jgi:hypothetical protein
MGGFFLDNICVLVGAFVLWLARGCSYSLEKEIPKKANEGLGRLSNWPEAVTGLVVLIVFVKILASFHGHG